MRGFGRMLLALVVTLFASAAAAQGQLNIVCSVQAPWCEAVANAFEKDTGIKVSFTQKSAGEAMAQIAAEKSNPKIDLWYTGTGDPHLQAAEMGLTDEYGRTTPNESPLARQERQMWPHRRLRPDHALPIGRECPC